MIAQFRRRLWALALGLLIVGVTTRDAQAAPIPYGTIGSVDTPPGGIPNLVFYNGVNGFVPASGSIDLGNFVVSSLAKTGTTDVDYKNDPFHIIVYSGSDQSVKLDGVLNGSLGPKVANPFLTATFNSVNPYGNNPLPFNLSVPLNTPLKLSVATDGSNPASTTFTAPVPEPASAVVFAAALGGLALWRRRAAR
ncbi:MAG: hypothetical protein NVSMB9_15030 [Isosphaeraceae bacterium]